MITKISKLTPVIILAFICIIFIPLNASSQQTQSEETDAILLKIKTKIPKNWNYLRTNTRIHFIRVDTVIVLNENRINAPSESKSALTLRIQKYGKPETAKVVYRYEPRWTKEAIQSAKAKNAEISKTSEQLPEKYNIKHLYDKSLSTKDNPVYTPTNEAEKTRVENYKKEYSALKDKYIEMPLFHSQKYSLFLSEIKGANDDFHVVFPEDASNEVYRIMVLVRELCDK